MDKATDLNNDHYPSIYQKIRLTISVWSLLLFSLFWIIIYNVENELEVISLHQWLDVEAKYYKVIYDKYGDNARLPNFLEFDSYWSEKPDAVPNWLDEYSIPGFYEHLLGDEDKHFLVFDHPSGKGLMYLVFKKDADDYLDKYESMLHIFMLIIAFVVTACVFIFGVYFIRHISAPFMLIESKIDKMLPSQPDFTVDTRYKETRNIEQTLLNNKNNIAGYFQREQEFNRFVSHELRTPMMVISGSADLLKKLPEQSKIMGKAINRIDVSCQEMSLLTDTFLLLAKKTIDDSYYSKTSLKTVLESQLEYLEILFNKHNISYKLNITNAAVISAPLSFPLVVMNNLIKNAFSYSVSDIDVELTDHLFSIANQHDGNSLYNAGYGCGLVIVERICERMGWSFDVDCDDTNYTAKINFKTIG